MSRAAAAALSLVVALAPAAAGKARPTPFEAAVGVEYGETPGPESLRTEIEGELLRRLTVDGCFAAVHRWTPGAAPRGDLLVRIVIDDLEDETRWDVTMAYRDDPRSAPDTRQRMTVTFEADVLIELRTAPETFLMDHRRLHKSLSHRPTMLGEDPRHELMLEYTELVVRNAAALACKPGEKKLRQLMQEARSREAARQN